MVRLTEEEIDSLTDCPDCEHWANEHSSQGCLGSVEYGTGVGPNEDQCVCMLTADRIAQERIAEILAARLAARDDEWRQAIEALDVGHSDPCTHPDEPCVCSVALLDLRAALHRGVK